MSKYIYLLAACFFTACQSGEQNVVENTDAKIEEPAEVADTLKYDGEVHLKNVRQLTFGGDNAEAYFSFDNSRLIFQRTGEEYSLECDQIFIGDLQNENFENSMVSTGLGRTTCSYFLPGDSLVLFASTHLAADECPKNEHMHDARQYLWPIFDSYEIFVADLEGNIVNQLTDNEFYDAEATVSPIGDKIVFTSNRSGDLELFTMNMDGSDVQQVTSGLGYDGGAFFSPDGTKLVFRASRPQTDEDQTKYKDLLAKGLVAPSNMEIYVCNVDGSELTKVTDLGNANWAPYFHPSGDKIIFCSNHTAERGFPFNLYMINVDGSGLEQITFDNMFDSFPMFSFDGKQLAFCSNRYNGGTRATNIFIADWVD